MSLQRTLKALSDPIRREILNLLKSGPMAAGDIAAKFDVTGAAVSLPICLFRGGGRNCHRRDRFGAERRI